MNQPQYAVARTQAGDPLARDWDTPAWSAAQTLTLTHFHPRSSDHRPLVQARLLHDDDTLYVFFAVADRYMLSRRTALNGPVCKDSCVEFFVQPKADAGYFNFEINAGGTLHTSYIEDPTPRPGGGFEKYVMFTPDDARLVRRVGSLPAVVDPEIAEPVDWTMRYALPVALFERYVGPIGKLSGQQWKGNFYKCADDSSHPHWASWAPLAERLSFHLPRLFSPIGFE